TRASVPTVSAHVHRLERLGVLRGYRADVDPLQLGETSVFLIVEAAAGLTGKVASAIARLPEVRRTVETREGRIVAEAILTRENETARFLRKVGKLRGVVAYEHHVASGRVKDERLRLRLERLQVDLDLRKEEVEGVDEGDRRAGVRDVGAGFRQEGDDVDVAPPTFVQQDAGHAGDHARLELLDPALLEFGPRAV